MAAMPKGRDEHWWAPLRVSLTYAVAAGLWILLSDALVRMTVRDPDVIALLSVAKGWAFVAVTSVILYGAVAGYVGRIGQERSEARASERRLSRIVATVPVGIIITDPSGRITFANDLAQHILRLESTDITSRTYDDPAWSIETLDGAPFPPERLPVARVLATGEAVRGVEHATIHPDGSRTLVSVNASPMREEGGALVGVVAAVTDITRRHEGEQRMMNLNRVYSTLGQMNQAIVRIRDEDELYSEACRIAVEYGRFRMAWVGRVDPRTDAVIPVARAGFDDGYVEQALITAADVARGRGPIGTSIRLSRTVLSNDIARDPFMEPWREGALARGYRSLASLPLRVDGETNSALAIYAAEAGFFDAEETRLLEELADDVAFGVTHIRQDRARRRAEEELIEHREHLEELVKARTKELNEANVRLREATEAKSRFLSSMSHELRTPLNSIIGFTAILLRGLAGEINAEQRKQLGMVSDAGTRLLALVNGILDLSRIEAGRDQPRVTSFELAEFAAAALESVRPLAEERGLALESRLPSESVMLHTDSEKLMRILLNLVENAVKYTDAGSVSFAVERTGDSLVFTVSDTGIGMEHDQLGVIFEEFYQVRGGSEEPDGTGLGLAISARLTKMLHGELLVASQPGQGSTFALRIPIDLEGGSA
jgi:PAS domain S-box-containing protein